MPAASYQRSSYGSRTPLSSRAISAVLAIGIGILLVLALVTLGVRPDRLIESNVLATFDVRPKAEEDTRSAPKAARTTPTRRPENPPPVTPPPLPPTPFPDMIILNRQDFAAADIARIAPSRAPGAGADTGSAADDGSGDSVGKGPDGQPLYNAQWYREPTRAEMATYMPARRVGGDAWGLIICKTVERYRVEDCRELGEAPGSGMAGAMRQAAWQFLVRPPRVGGKPLVGAWVRIRFDVTEARE